MNEQTKDDFSKDPIECLNGGWGFWDETWGHWYGPYENEMAARSALREYAENL